MKHASTGTNYAILAKQVKVQHEKKPVSNLKSMQIVVFEQTSSKFIKIGVLFSKNNFFIQKKPAVETISMAINDRSNVLGFHLNLVNIFAKSTKAERCTDITFKLTLYYCLSVTVEDLNL